jgi:hypothetical protein
MKLPVQFGEPAVIWVACGNLLVEGFDFRQVVVGQL